MCFCLFFVLIKPISAKPTKTDSLLRVASQLNYSNDQTIKLLLENSTVYTYEDEYVWGNIEAASKRIKKSNNDTLWCSYYTKKTLAVEYIQLQHNDSIFKYASLASDYCTLCKDTLNVIRMESGIIDHFLYKNNNEQAFKHITKMLHLSTAIENDYMQASSYLMLGFFYYNIKNYKEAINAYELCLEKVAKTPYVSQSYACYRYLAILYYLLGDYEESIVNCKASLAFFPREENLNKAPYVYTLYEQNTLLMLLYKLTGHEKEARNMLPSVESVLSNEIDLYYEHYINYFLGEYYYSIESYTSAIHYLEISKSKYNDRIPSDIIGLVVNRLGQSTMKVGDLEKSSIYFELAHRMNDSLDIVRRNNILNITDWKVKYDLETKKELIDELEDENEKAYTDLIYKNYIILLSLLSIFIIYLVFAFKKKKNLREKVALWDRNRLLTEEKEKLRKQNTVLLESIESIQKAIQKEEKKYGNSNLTEAEMLKVEELILKLLVDKKYYLNPKLTLESFAKKLDVNRSYLSQIINQRFEMNFRQLINYHRIIEAHKILCAEENENYSIDYIAKEAGFKSVSPFIQAFKNHTGVTPAVYRKKHKESIQ